MSIENKTIVASRNQLASRLGDEVVILNLDDGQYYGLNALGAFVWERISTPTSFGELVEAIMTAYDVERGRCQDDLTVLIDRLVAQKLVEVHELQDPAGSAPAE